MGFSLKKLIKPLEKVVKQVNNDVLKPAIKDAVPLTAAYFTGGASLSALPPENLLGSILGGGEAPPQEEVLQSVPSYQTQPQVARLVAPIQQQTAVPQRGSFDQLGVSLKEQDDKKLLYIGGGVGLLAILLIAMMQGRK